MIWEKDKLRPTQPYFVFDTTDFRQKICLQQGISHFYSFYIEKGHSMRIVPDGCIDLFFEYHHGKMQGYACGTSLTYSCEQTQKEMEVFGVRFMPGVQPAILKLTMRELLKHKIPISCASKEDITWLECLEKEHDFQQQICIFMEHYSKAEKKTEKPFGKKELVQSVKQLVYDSNGKIKISDLQNKTGYSERYINRVFLEEMGFSPKTFCKIIQFQKVLEFLNYGNPGRMTDIAVSFGYYDQPQFIRDFTKYAGITPKKYLNLVKEQHYQNKINQIEYFDQE